MEKNLTNIEKFLLSHKLLNDYLLFPLLSLRDLIEIAKVNRVMNKLVKNYFLYWKEELQLLAELHNLDLKSAPIDDTKLNAIKNNRKYLVKGTKANYRKIEMNSVNYLAGAHGESWAWSEDKRYWEFKENQESMFGGITPVLNYVWWINACVSIPKVKVGKYNVILRHGLNQYYEMKNVQTLTISFDNKEKKKVEVYKTNFMTKQMLSDFSNIFQNNYGRLFNFYITTIDLKEYTDELYIDLQLLFYLTEGTCKSGWLFDGFILEEVNQ